MSVKLITFLAILLSGSIFYGPRVNAQSFTYQGELNQNGSPASGAFDFEFQLWDGESTINASQIGASVSISDVFVSEGRFTVELDFDAESFDNSDRWLRVRVNGLYLDPFQKINHTPYAIQTRGIFADINDEIGLGTTNPSARLDVVSDTTDNGNNTARFSAPMLGPNTSHVHFGMNGNWFIRSAADAGQVIVQDTGGVVGIGTSNPGDNAKLTVSAPEEEQAILALSLDNTQPTFQALNIGGGPAVWAQGSSDVSANGGGLIVVGSESDLNIGIDTNEIMARDNGMAAGLLINREGGDVIVGSASGGTSRLITPVLQITGGSDFSEMFDVGGNGAVMPGMVVVIDTENPGQLVPSTVANNRRVAGIISGAGGVATGMRMGQEGSIANGEHPVALTGRVYCLVDCYDQAVAPGDLLTTSSTRGHAMKVKDLKAAQGAIIGKAMTPLAKGERGLVLVLVNLQ